MSAQPSAEPRLLYDRKEAARILSLSVRSLDYLIQQQRIATRRVGKKVLIHRTELTRFAKGNHTGPIRDPK
jgi:excisionase family DNA binding protein